MSVQNAASRRQSRKPTVGSAFDKYPMPFFDKKSRNFWRVRTTGDYEEDYQIGASYGELFLASCDGTVGWIILFTWIVGAMLENSEPKGIRLGFMRVIGRSLCEVAPAASMSARLH